MRQSPNLRYTARGRPQRRQREWARVLYFGGRDRRTIFDFLAIKNYLGMGIRPMPLISLVFIQRPSCSGDRLAGEAVEAGRAPLAGEGQPEAVEQRERLGVGLGRCGD